MERTNERDHYEDGYIDVRYDDNMAMWVLFNCEGDSKAIKRDDNFFDEEDVVKAYEGLWRDFWNDDKGQHVAKLRLWLNEREG